MFENGFRYGFANQADRPQIWEPVRVNPEHSGNSSIFAPRFMGDEARLVKEMERDGEVVRWEEERYGQTRIVVCLQQPQEDGFRFTSEYLAGGELGEEIISELRAVCRNARIQLKYHLMIPTRKPPSYYLDYEDKYKRTYLTPEELKRIFLCNLGRSRSEIMLGGFTYLMIPPKHQDLFARLISRAEILR